MMLSLASKNDFEDIYKLWLAANLSVRKSNLEKYDFEKILELNPTSCFIATEKNNIIATVFGTFNGRRAWIYHLAVDPHYQRNGYGSLLLKKVEAALKVRGAKKIILGVALKNAETMPFYKKNGYDIMNDAILMTKEI